MTNPQPYCDTNNRKLPLPGGSKRKTERSYPAFSKKNWLKKTYKMKADIIREPSVEEGNMNSSQTDMSRFFIGSALVVIAVLMVLYVNIENANGGALLIGLIGLVSMATAKRR
jgi:hypothetical protein